MVRCRYILRVTLVYVSFSSFWFSFLTRARARAEDTTEEKLRRFLSNAWSCLFERSASFDLNSTEKEVHQHVFSFEGIRARESILSAHPPSPSICLSLSLSPVQKGGERRDNSIFFRNSNLGNWEKKGGKENRRAKVRNAFFFFLFWMNFGTMHLCCYVLNGGGDLQKI